jgi:hypothetical protein
LESGNNPAGIIVTFLTFVFGTVDDHPRGAIAEPNRHLPDGAARGATRHTCRLHVHDPRGPGDADAPLYTQVGCKSREDAIS